MPAPAANGSERTLNTTGVVFTRSTADLRVSSCSATITSALASSAASMRLGSVARSPWALEMVKTKSRPGSRPASCRPTLSASSLHSLPIQSAARMMATVLGLGAAEAAMAVLSAALPASPLAQAPSAETRIRADAASARAGRNREPDRSNIGRTPGKDRGKITQRLQSNTSLAALSPAACRYFPNSFSNLGFPFSEANVGSSDRNCGVRIPPVFRTSSIYSIARSLSPRIVSRRAALSRT